jgi:DNA mismatch endonuclease (patch repair protein)
MRQQRRQDTAPEIKLRRALHAIGLRFRLQVPVVGTRRRVDIAFPAAKVAVDVRGCYWHACAMHATTPVANAGWWQLKLRANMDRDADTERRLRMDGWRVIVVWEHDEPASVAARIAAIVAHRTARSDGQAPSRPMGRTGANP